jgi:(4S)-4-hydroxy-5-phosphonooxypentane-2,3-dione isomerase
MSLAKRDTGALFAIIVAFELTAGGFDKFKALVCQNAAESVRNEPGCLRLDVLLPPKS